jgi:hypothetical protein
MVNGVASATQDPALGSSAINERCMILLKKTTLQAPFVSVARLALQNQFCMYGILNEVYLQNLFTVGITFRDKSNELSFIMICYSNITVIIL